MAADPILVFASFEPVRGEEDAVLHVLRTVAASTRAEPGCQTYDLLRSETDDGATSFHIFERYRDDAALEAHRSSDHFRDYRAAITDLLAAPIGVVVLRQVDPA